MKLNPIKNKQNKTLSTKDEGTKKRSMSGAEKKILMKIPLKLAKKSKMNLLKSW